MTEKPAATVADPGTWTTERRIVSEPFVLGESRIVIHNDIRYVVREDGLMEREDGGTTSSDS